MTGFYQKCVTVHSSLQRQTFMLKSKIPEKQVSQKNSGILRDFIQVSQDFQSNQKALTFSNVNRHVE